MHTAPLTRELALRPASNRYLSAVVAEHVMGWKQGPPHGGYVEADGSQTGFFLDAVDQRRWNPLENLEQAFLVVERMARTRVPFELRCAFYGAGWSWSARFGNGESAIAETAPEAICRAAMLTRVEDE